MTQTPINTATGPAWHSRLHDHSHHLLTALRAQCETAAAYFQQPYEDEWLQIATETIGTQLKQSIDTLHTQKPLHATLAQQDMLGPVTSLINLALLIKDYRGNNKPIRELQPITSALVPSLVALQTRIQTLCDITLVPYIESLHDPEPRGYYPRFADDEYKSRFRPDTYTPITPAQFKPALATNTDQVRDALAPLRTHISEAQNAITTPDGKTLLTSFESVLSLIEKDLSVLRETAMAHPSRPAAIPG